MKKQCLLRKIDSIVKVLEIIKILKIINCYKISPRFLDNLEANLLATTTCFLKVEIMFVVGHWYKISLHFKSFPCLRFMERYLIKNQFWTMPKYFVLLPKIDHP